MKPLRLPTFIHRPHATDERREIRALRERLEVRSWQPFVLAFVCAGAAAGLAYLPTHAGLSADGRHALFILLLATGLWVTEAISAFGTALVVVGLNVLLVADLGVGDEEWFRFFAPWSSPLIWLFIGGFVLGKAAAKTGLDIWLARKVLRACGTSPSQTLMGVMIVGSCLSMFMSNTAAAAMLFAVVTPIVGSRPAGDTLRKALLLGVAASTNIGGMGTLIGSPPNAIAAGAQGPGRELDFATWMLLGLPPAVVLVLISFWYLRRSYVRDHADLPRPRFESPAPLALWRRAIVMGTFVVTIGLWLTTRWHGVPSSVISFLPIALFAAAGIIRSEDVRSLQWDVLILIFGGLSLGLVVQESGLAAWLVQRLPLSDLELLSLALVMAYLTVILSNFMSNTAASTVLIPLGVALSPQFGPALAVPVALAASNAMCLPISTPPNAIVASSDELETKDFVKLGLLLALIAPIIAVMWTFVLVPLLFR